LDRKENLLGKNILGKAGFNFDISIFLGSGAYVCGEETALIESIEGKRGTPKPRPPFPAQSGLYGRPTVVNNVESIASVPAIIANGAEWYQSMGTEKSKGATLYSLSGHVNNPGQFEAPLGITLRQILELAGGVRNGHKLKFWTPGGSSTPLFTDEHLDVPLDYEGVSAAGSMLGTKALQIFDETTCVVRAVLRWTEFYKHESCGKCTPCREGTIRLLNLLKMVRDGKARKEDLNTLKEFAAHVQETSLCGLGQSCGNHILSSLANFPKEYEKYLKRIPKR
jgi:NADH-quinone oxidoreductase subunit F